jgi:CRISPR-associated protein Cas1
MRNDKVRPDQHGSKPHTRPLAEDEITAILAGLEAGFADDPAAISDIAVVLGSGAQVKVERGHLVLRDGEGWYRRERRYNRATGRLRRLLVGAQSGYVSLTALRWCAATNVAVLILDDDGEVMLAPGEYGIDDGRLRRVQAAPPNGLDVDAARLLLVAKLQAQAVVARERLDDYDTADTLFALAEGLDDATSVDECRQLEASGAACYFAAWISHPATTLRFAQADRIPDHWFAFDGRRSLLSKGVSARRAHQPLGALLNLAYKLAEVEVRLACTAIGLDAALGFVHTDIARRDSLALDVLEPVRPVVDQFVLDLIAERTFARADFVERSDGSIRIAPRLVQECAAAMPLFARTAAPHAEAIGHLLGRAVVGKWQPTTKLTGRKARSAQAEVKARKIAAARASVDASAAQARARRARADQGHLFASCLRCGGPLSRSRHLYCDQCQDTTPSHARDTRRRRGQSIALQRTNLERWRAEHPDERGDPDEYRRTILPGLALVKLVEIMAACGISKTTASQWRAGRATPALRHWEALRHLGTDEAK